MLKFKEKFYPRHWSVFDENNIPLGDIYHYDEWLFFADDRETGISVQEMKEIAEMMEGLDAPGEYPIR